MTDVESGVTSTKRSRWDNPDASKKAKISSEWDDVEKSDKKESTDSTPSSRRKRWDETPQGVTSSTPARSSRWDATPDNTSSSSRSGGWDETPKKVSTDAETPSKRTRSRWDETPLNVGLGGSTPNYGETPLGNFGGETPNVSHLVGMTPEHLHALRW